MTTCHGRALGARETCREGPRRGRGQPRCWGVLQQSCGWARRERACDGWRRAWCWGKQGRHVRTGETREHSGQGNKADARCVEMSRAEQATGEHTDYTHGRCARQDPGTHKHGLCPGLTLRARTQPPSVRPSVLVPCNTGHHSASGSGPGPGP